jgi:predicted NUDIX family NTP pyrophosphohydrolase
LAERSAGILFYRRDGGATSVLLVHPGGPFWRNRDAGAWQIPKGGIEEGEDPAAAARREVQEELGVSVTAPLEDLGEVRQSGGKRVQAFAVAQDFDADAIASNGFDLEWPPRSGRIQTFPEVDAARWFPIDKAREMMLTSQLPLLDRLAEALRA